jgi:hypothetical protein
MFIFDAVRHKEIKMSYDITTRISCDAIMCHNEDDFDTGNIDDAKELAEACGWLAKDGKDFCPFCHKTKNE